MSKIEQRNKAIKETASVVSQEQIGEDIFSIFIKTSLASSAKAGQFVSLFTRDGSKLLPRPISICEVFGEGGIIRLVYRVTGENTGTKLFSLLTEGDTIEIMGPLGNGFEAFVNMGEMVKSEKFIADEKKPKDNKRNSEEANKAPMMDVKNQPWKVMLIGGGIGVPPMLQLAKDFSDKLDKTQILGVMGYQGEVFLAEDFEQFSTLYISTEEGTRGTEGNVLDAIDEHHLSADAIYACGPMPMLKAIQAYANEKNVPCYLSTEEKMACGIGACLACICKTKEKDTHSNLNQARICKDGPVFDGADVIL